jgi:uncharacterized membrane protein
MKTKLLIRTALMATLPLCGQVRFVRLGAINTYVGGISGDGSVVVGSRTPQGGPLFRWTAAEGVVNIGGFGQLARISRDGRTIVSTAKGPDGVVSAAIWQGGTSWRVLGGLPGQKPLDNKLSTAYSVSGDGSIIVGLLYTSPAHAFRWDAVNGMVDLGSIHGRNSRANWISADGHVIVGWDEDPTQQTGLFYDVWRGAIWWSGIESLIHPFGWIGPAEATNGSGSIIVGRGHPAAPRHAYMYTAWNGQVEDLGALDRGLTPGAQRENDTSGAFAVSDDPSIVVGESGLTPPAAFIWTPQEGMVSLLDYLKERGATGLDRWWLLGAGSIAPDGKTVAGTGINPDGDVEGWVAILE